MSDQKVSDLATGTISDTTLFYGTNNPGVSQNKFTGLAIKQYAGGAGIGLPSQVTFNKAGVADGADGLIYDFNTNRTGLGIAAGTTPAARLEIRDDNLGATTPDTAGAVIQNTTPAAAGAQQNSPTLTWTAQGWKTAATAASQPVAFSAYTFPIQGAAAPSGVWRLASSINGGTYNEVMNVSSTGSLQLRNTTGPTLDFLWNGNDRGGSLTLNGGNMQHRGSYQSVVDSTGNGIARFSAQNSNNVTNFFTLIDDAVANVMALRNGTTAQSFRLYNTFTSTTVYERGVMDWQATTNVLTIGAQAGGTGTLRQVQLVGAVVNTNAGEGHKRTTVADANYSVLATDYMVAYTSLTAARNVTLPLVGSAALPQFFIIKDESGAAASFNITVTPASGTIDGSATKTISAAYGMLRVYCNGTSFFQW